MLSKLPFLVAFLALIVPGLAIDIRPEISAYGYPVETHSTVTSDGFTLNIVRVPYGTAGRGNGTRPVVFLQHGLEDSCATWFIGTPQQALGYILADAGFDVWVGNSRGTTYSPPPNNNWDWSWDEMAAYDLPASLSLALNTTGAETLTYVGHSQGTMIMFAQGANPQVASMVNLFVALAPVAYLSHTSAPLLHTIANVPKLDFFINLFGLQEFNAKSIPQKLCALVPHVCDLTICMMAGCEGGLTTAMTVQLAEHFPDLTSWRNLEHYEEAIKNNRFNRFKGSDYDLEGWAVKSVLFFGGRDTLADPTDVEQLLPRLPKSLVETQYMPTYGHSSFVWNSEAKDEIYPEIVALAKAVAPKSASASTAIVRSRKGKSQL